MNGTSFKKISGTRLRIFEDEIRLNENEESAMMSP